MNAVPIFLRIGAFALASAAVAAAAQGGPPRPDQIGKDPNALLQEAEAQRARERERERQEHSSRQQADQQWNDNVHRQQSRAAADQAQAAAVLRSWQQRPPLAPEKNPLLGRWESQPGGQRTSDPGVAPELERLANALLGNLVAETCRSMLGPGTVEFRPGSVVAIGRDGSARPMYPAEYRGGGNRVVVLPKGDTTFTHMIIDFEGAGRAQVAGVACSLARVSQSAAKAAAPAAAGAAPGRPGARSPWTLIGSSPVNGGMDVYVDLASIRRSGLSARMTDLWDFRSPQTFAGKPFLSAHADYEYDCAGGRQRMLGFTGHSGPMGQGTSVAIGQAGGAWESVGRFGQTYDRWVVACRRQVQAARQ